MCLGEPCLCLSELSDVLLLLLTIQSLAGLPGKLFAQLWLLHTSARATWVVSGDQGQGEKGLMFWFSL